MEKYIEILINKTKEISRFNKRNCQFDSFKGSILHVKLINMLNSANFNILSLNVYENIF